MLAGFSVFGWHLKVTGLTEFGGWVGVGGELVVLVVVLWLFGGVGVVGGDGMEWKKLGMFGEKNGVVWKKFSPTFCLEKFEVFLLDILVSCWWWCFLLLLGSFILSTFWPSE